VFRIAVESIAARVRGEVAVHIRVVGEVAIGQSSWSYLAFWIHVGLLVIRVDISHQVWA